MRLQLFDATIFHLNTLSQRHLSTRVQTTGNHLTFDSSAKRLPPASCRFTSLARERELACRRYQSNAAGNVLLFPLPERLPKRNSVRQAAFGE
jgi:hypothetical protein